jgi:hypothetical protein
MDAKYDKQDQQGKAAFNERNPLMTQQQEPMARNPGGPQTKTGQGKDKDKTLPLTHDVVFYNHRGTKTDCNSNS